MKRAFVALSIADSLQSCVTRGTGNDAIITCDKALQKKVASDSEPGLPSQTECGL